MAEVFNSAAKKRLSTPEQLDKAIKITSPLSWLVLIAITIILGVGLAWSIKGSIPVTVTANGLVQAKESSIGIYVPEQCNRVNSVAYAGSELRSGDSVLNYDTGNGEKSLIIESALIDGVIGTVSRVLVEEGKEASLGADLLRITPNIDDDLVAICFVSTSDVSKIRTGMPVRIYPSGADKQKTGFMEGTVIHIDAQATTDKGFESLGDSGYASEFRNNKSVQAVICKITTADEKSNANMPSTAKNGYYWSNEKGYEVPLETIDGYRAEMKIITETITPIAKAFSWLKEKWGD